VPEYIQNDCTPENLASALRDLLADSPQRSRQVEAFRNIDAIMAIGSQPPSARAADIVLTTGRQGRPAD
jgi:lipid-A-disaccharide synthase